MKKFLKGSSLLLAGILLLSIPLVGCGSKSTDDVTITTQDKQQQSTVSKSDTDKKDTTSNTTGTVYAGDKKRLVIVEGPNNDQDTNTSKKNIISELKKNGYNSSNMELKELYLSGSQKQSPQEVTNTIKEFKPDVACFIGASDPSQLAGSKIPCIDNFSAENFVDANTGLPKDNITGIYTMPKGMKISAFKLLNRIAPINGKKAVFITVDGFFKKDDVQKALSDVGIELKDYCESKYIEDFQSAVNKYNNDPDVGWMLVGVWPWTKKDGTVTSMTDISKWDVSNRTKPTVTYWETAVSNGLLCGLCVDIPALGIQQGDMVARIFKGEKVQNIKAEDPQKMNIAINKKNGDQLGIKFPVDILGSAKIYTDYEGHSAN